MGENMGDKHFKHASDFIRSDHPFENDARRNIESDPGAYMRRYSAFADMLPNAENRSSLLGGDNRNSFWNKKDVKKDLYLRRSSALADRRLSTVESVRSTVSAAGQQLSTQSSALSQQNDMSLWEVLYEYSQLTSFHGLYHITAPQPFLIRR